MVDFYRVALSFSHEVDKDGFASGLMSLTLSIHLVYCQLWQTCVEWCDDSYLKLIVRITS